VEQLVWPAVFLIHPVEAEPITWALSLVSWRYLRAVAAYKSDWTATVTGSEVMNLTFNSKINCPSPCVSFSGFTVFEIVFPSVIVSYPPFGLNPVVNPVSEIVYLT